ncbi:hypothetical protein PISMIDRAFT_690971 [Pisolithus microcarpus 441]|uniref:Uncharacterized protein n=1 Tax=Pisolithus microcarpus 441 TaxID=765257 RepID=A0A0C9YJK8_9AGAM|nr:hypothetical protein PISMIDRAFT_690971 [Pisolithus microcarpus 441]
MKPTDGKPMEVSRFCTGNGGKLPDALVFSVSGSHSLFKVYRTPTISIVLARRRSENCRSRWKFQMFPRHCAIYIVRAQVAVDP